MNLIPTAPKLPILLSLFLISVLSACQQPAPPIEPEQSHEQLNTEDKQPRLSYSFSNPDSGQEFTILHAYSLYENFFEAVEKNPKVSPYDLYDDEVIQPVYEACFKDAELIDATFAVALQWTPPKSEYDNLKGLIGRMNTDQLNQVFEESLLKSSDMLPADKETTVCIFPENEDYPSEMITFGSNEILVFYNKYDKYYKPGMAHEYHHSVWLGKHVKEDEYLTVFDHLALEGQAVMFESLVYPELNATQYAVDESFNNEYWNQIESYFDSISGYDIHDLIQGGANGLPEGYGYSEGYKIIRSYLELHPDMTVEEWTSKDPIEIFEDGNYMANYQ